jgi:cyclic dehypoxanthinyl futalosine synthase
MNISEILPESELRPLVEGSRDSLLAIYDNIRNGQRISREEAITLYLQSPLVELSALAFTVRQRNHPSQHVSYLIDRNINYTNVCSTDCSFCAFYRHNPRAPDAYVNSKEIIAQKITEALELGATRILLQGGHNDELPYEYYTDLVSWISSTFPIEINAFSPSEIQQMSRISGKTSLQVLTELRDCGLRGLPGGGAEILDDEVRRRVSPKKIKADEWILIMAEAQSLRLTTTATMVIGFGESVENRLNHFERIRGLQDKSNRAGLEGFNSFISWPLQHNEKTSLGRSRSASGYGATAGEYLRNLALARIFLDNIPHHQSSWPTMGPKVAQAGLWCGCDDIGSTMMEENVVSQAGGASKDRWCMSPDELQVLIREAGFLPRQRNTSFDYVT